MLKETTRMNNRNSEIVEGIKQIQKTFQPIVQCLVEVNRQTEVFTQRLIKVFQPFVPYMEAFVKYHKIVEAFDKTGWLPYHSAPVHYVEECGGDVHLLETRLSEYYRTHWDDIRQDIESRLDDYNIDEEARATFREALSAHNIGHYRCVVRLLFPEIERMFRVQFFENKAGLFRSNEMLKKLTDDKYLEDFTRREAFGWTLFGRLVKHLYEPSITETQRDKFKHNFVPNRNAALHGLVIYSTEKHSMNMIIMADYIFQILTPQSI